MFFSFIPPYSISKNQDSTFDLSYTIMGDPIGDFSLYHIGTFPTYEAAIAHIKELLKKREIVNTIGTKKVVLKAQEKNLTNFVVLSFPMKK